MRLTSATCPASPPGCPACHDGGVSAPEDPYPEIGQILTRSAPKGWERIELDVRLWDGAARFQATSFGVGQPPGLRLENASRLRVLFERVQAISREVADPGTPVWTTAKFALRSDGSSTQRTASRTSPGSIGSLRWSRCSSGIPRSQSSRTCRVGGKQSEVVPGAPWKRDPHVPPHYPPKAT